jgi:hypothetical protein
MVSAQAIEQNKYFTVSPNTTYSCIYIDLPNDLGVSRTSNTISAIIRSENPWIDTTYTKLAVNPSVATKSPVCFYYKDRSSGDYSFYTIALSSPELNIYKTFDGGICVSKYRDVEISQNITNKTDICSLLSSSNDIFSVQFKNEYMFAESGKTITQNLYITSYAYLEMGVELSSDLQVYPKEQTVSTSPANPTKTIPVTIRTTEEGEYYVNAKVKIKGCALVSCQKDTRMMISVGENVKSGFDLSVVPNSINIEKPDKIKFTLIISNHETQKDFNIRVSSDPSAKLEPASANVRVMPNDDYETVFEVTPSSENDLYTISFNVEADNLEQMVTAYLSVGEMVSDIQREEDSILSKTTDQSLRNSIASATQNWIKNHDNATYGSDLKEYEGLKNTLENAKKTIGSNTNQTNPPSNNQPSGGEEFNWLLYIVPVAILIVVVIFILYKKSKTVRDIEYPGFEEFGRE